MARERRYPPKGALLAGRYYEAETGDLILLYHAPGVKVRIPKAELSEPDWTKRKRRTKQVA